MLTVYVALLAAALALPAQALPTPAPQVLVNQAAKHEPAPYPMGYVPFSSCPIPAGGTPAQGTVSSVTVSPCERGEDDEPCRFRHGLNYTISVEYESDLVADSPRTTLTARDDSTVPSLRYPYSGQSFDACQYTDCPVKADRPSTYVYYLHTLMSPFNSLTINMTQTLDGPSLLCTSFAALYIPSEQEEQDDAPDCSSINA